MERRVGSLHMPVLRSRDDADCFEPLKGLQSGSTEHADDEEGTIWGIKVVEADNVNLFRLATERRPRVRYKSNRKVWLTLRADLGSMIAERSKILVLCNSFILYHVLGPVPRR